MKVAAACALAGATDTAAFVWTRREALRRSPGRWRGSLAGLGLWTALTAACLRGGTPARTLAGANAGVNAVLLGVHVRHRITTPRVLLGAGLSMAALVATLRDV